MSNNREKLFTEFAAPTTQEWLDKIQVDLKGADFNKRLVWRTNEGFNVQPFYRREDVLKLKTPESLPGQFPYVRGNKKADNEWYVRQDIIAGEDPKEANAKALDILNKGVDSIGFRFPGDYICEEYVEGLLEGIYCECVELNFTTCARRSLQLAKILTAYFDAHGCDRNKVVCSITWDPIERLLLSGRNVLPILQFGEKIVEVVKDFPNFRCITVNSVSLNNAGAYIVTELGYALAWGNEYLNMLTESGIDATTAAKKIKFNMGISENYFMEIAKFRAARMLWAQIVKKYEADDEACKMCVNAQTSRYNMTLFDSYVNLLRTQTETMSAAIGGVHSIIVTPFDSVYEQPSDFSERIARNQQLLLKEESHFDKVVDPSAGSYYIEELTHLLAEAAWKVFLDIEAQGGFLEAVKAGTIQDAVNATNAKRHDDAAKRKEFILGTNQFPNFTETSEGKKSLIQGHACMLHGGHSHPEEFKSIATTRLADDYEELRLATERSAKTPIAFMLTIGNLAMRQARAQFSSNFLACAGYKIIDNLGFDTVEHGVDAALAADADIVVICSSDDEYATYAVPAYEYLAGRAMFIVAGAPACMEDLKAAGIENFIHVRSNVLETLKSYNEKLLK